MYKKLIPKACFQIRSVSFEIRKETNANNWVMLQYIFIFYTFIF